jgi:hypothetical protein
VQLTEFDIGHPELNGFEAYYDKEVLPFLEQTEESRREAVKKSKIGIAVLAVIALVIGFFSFQRYQVYQALLFPGLGFIAASGGLFHFLTHKIGEATKEKIVGAICAYVKWSFVAKIDKKPDVSAWQHIGLLPKNSAFKIDRKMSFEDHIFGKVHGADFESMEIHIEEHRDKKWRTLMRGQMMVLTFPRKFLGTTVVLRDQKFFQSKKIADMKRVGLVDPVFEKIFEAYSTDQVEARYLLTPTFMQRLVDLETSVSGKNIRFGFLEGRLLIVVETPNQFEAGSMFQSLMSPDRTQKILNEIAAIFHLVDGVLDPKLK